MPPGLANLSVYQGDDFGVTVTFTLDGAPYPLTGHTFSAQLRTTTADADSGGPPLADFVCLITDVDGGELDVTLPSEVTETLAAGNCRWDLQSDVGGIVRTWLVGTVVVTAEVTRP
jgi:hypothetical protein